MKVICALIVIINVKLCLFASFCRLAKNKCICKKEKVKKKKEKPMLCDKQTKLWNKLPC